MRTEDQPDHIVNTWHAMPGRPTWQLACGLHAQEPDALQPFTEEDHVKLLAWVFLWWRFPQGMHTLCKVSEAHPQTRITFMAGLS